jgi:hypothetical protein
MNEAFTSIVIGSILTIVILILGFTLNIKWLKILAILPLLISLLPLLFLFLIFGDCC